MSNLIKSGFISFSENEKLIINPNDNEILKSLDKPKIIRPIEEKKSNQEDALLDDEEDEDIFSQEVENIYEDADKIIEDAREQAKEIIDEALIEAERTNQKAIKDGYGEGYKKGIKEGKKEYELKEQELVEAIQQKEKELNNKYNIYLNEAEPQMVDTLCDVFSNLIGISLENKKSVVLYLLDKAMKDIEDCKNFNIKVSDDDYDYVMENKHQIHGAGNPSLNINIFADSKLKINQCVIETELGIIDCSLDEQMKNLLETIKMLSKQ